MGEMVGPFSPKKRKERRKKVREGTKYWGGERGEGQTHQNWSDSLGPNHSLNNR